MAHPLTDEQFERVKNKHVPVATHVHFNHVTQRDFDSLIATVEREYARNKAAMKGWDISLENHRKTLKENAKLKKAHHDMTVEYERVRNEAWFGLDHDELVEENAKLKAEGMYWKHTAANWMPGKDGMRLKLDGWGKNFTGLNGMNELRLK